MNEPCPNKECLFIIHHDGECSNVLDEQHAAAKERAQAALNAEHDGGFDPDIFNPTATSRDLLLGRIGKAMESSPIPVNWSVQGRVVHTHQAYEILARLEPEWLDLFLAKNEKYKAVGNDLGARGVFPDVNRKVGILKDRIWDGNAPVGEPTREVIFDLIGHLFLMQYMLDQEMLDS